jgi:lipoate-protein ligase A
MYKIFTTDNLDPWYNLAIENWLLHNKELTDDDILFLWRNRPSIVIGRFQNPWLECRLKEMGTHGISFVRRTSGGGAVYHDEGNSNFTFIASKEGFSRTEKTDMIVQALRSLKIDAVRGKRYDVYVKGKKVSGSASKITKDKVIHHGTLLINADLTSLGKYLKSSYYEKNQIESKGIASVRSPVANLTEFNRTINHNLFSNALIQLVSSLQDEEIEIHNLNLENLQEIKDIENFRETLMSWDWLYGNTPGFSLEMVIPYDGTENHCSITVKKGLIVRMESDNEDLCRVYRGTPCERLLL